MPKVSRWLSLALLPIAAFLDGGAYYGARSALFVHLQGGGVAIDAYPAVLIGGIIASLVGTAFAGVIGLSKRPLLGGVLGAAVLGLAAALLAALPVQDVVFGTVTLGFAHGLLRTSILGAAAHAFGDTRSEHMRNAACMLVYGAANFAALLFLPLVEGLLLDGNETAAFVLSGLGAAPILLLLLLLDGVAFWGPREKDELSEPLEREGRHHLVIVAVVLLAGGFVWTFWSTGFELVFERLREGSGTLEEQTGFMKLNPAIVSLGCLVGAGVSVAMHWAKARVSTLLPLGIGMVLVSASLFVLVAADGAGRGLLLMLLVIMSVGEALVGPLLISRVAGDVNARLHTALIALFFLITTVPTLLINPVIVEHDLAPVVSAVSGVSAGLLGLGFIVAAVLGRRLFFPEPNEPTSF